MPYNFTDDPTPTLTTAIDATGNVYLTDGSPQNELITNSYQGRSVTVSIAPPSGWTLVSVTWAGGGSGTIFVPPAGQETTHAFNYEVADATSNQKGSGVFKIKKTDPA